MFLLDWIYRVLASLGLWQKEAKILFLGPDIAGKGNLLHMLQDERLVQHQPTQYLTSEELSTGVRNWRSEALALALKIWMAYNMQRSVHHRPTQYLPFGEFSIGKIKFKAFNLRGHLDARRLLMDYHVKVDAVVYLVDAFEHSFDESRIELQALLRDDSLANVPFLILGNKIDMPYAAAKEEQVILLRSLFLCNGHHFRTNIDIPIPATKEKLCKDLDLSEFTTGKERPLEVFMCSKMDYVDGFKWLSLMLSPLQ